MGKNRSVDSNRTKAVVRYLYFLAKRKGLVEDVMIASGVRSVKSLQWSYTQGKISEEQIAGYVSVLGVDRDFITGARQMTVTEQQQLELNLANKFEDATLKDIDYVQVQHSRNEFDNDMEVYRKVFAVITEDNNLLIFRVIEQKTNFVVLETSTGQLEYPNKNIFEIFESNSPEFFGRQLAFIKQLENKINEKVPNLNYRKQTINLVNALFTREDDIIKFTTDYLCYIESKLEDILFNEPLNEDLSARIYFLAHFTHFFDFGDKLKYNLEEK